MPLAANLVMGPKICKGAFMCPEFVFVLISVYCQS